jgi:formylglycine-generating enzyme required for sulfatase activity
LPTEGEWEFACRAGTSTTYSFGSDPSKLGEYGWCGQNSGGKTHIVGQKLPNAFGLYDMHGNVWEWCGDSYDAGYYPNSPLADPRGPLRTSYRVDRGGSWRDRPRDCRSGERGGDLPTAHYHILGFRLARSQSGR